VTRDLQVCSIPFVSQSYFGNSIFSKGNDNFRSHLWFWETDRPCVLLKRGNQRNTAAGACHIWNGIPLFLKASLLSSHIVVVKFSAIYAKQKFPLFYDTFLVNYPFSHVVISQAVSDWREFVVCHKIKNYTKNYPLPRPACHLRRV